ncbi:hypothetical protein Q5P01_005249 [Channa striata]|uniref:Uncharacterized protein n=1 Tax=Channa striata TaxID=64152 RepID=A0AA88NCI0_CHASR|nr:hypothetical protein Q5P01_005249 [Channa striata]
MEKTPIGQAPTLTPQGLSGSRTTSSLAPLDINECANPFFSPFFFCTFHSRSQKVFHLHRLSGKCVDTSAPGLGAAQL